MIRKNLQLQAKDLERIGRKIRLLINNGPFKEENLTLRRFAHLIDENSNALSFYLNESFQENFKTFINRARVEYFLQSATEEALRTQTLLVLAMDAGVASKSTFNRVFKEITGETPREYLKKRSYIS